LSCKRLNFHGKNKKKPKNKKINYNEVKAVLSLKGKKADVSREPKH
jgi:hypothetical protein